MITASRRPLRSRAKTAKLCVGIAAGVGVFVATSNALALSLGFQMNEPFAPTGVTTGIVLLMGFVTLAALVAGAAALIRWQKRAYDDAVAHGVELSFSRASAVSAWFIPVASLVLPYRHMAELDRATAPGESATRTANDVRLWWALWLAPMFSGLAGDDAFGILVSLVAQLCQAGSAVLLMRIIDRLTDRIEGVEGPIEF